MSQTIEEEFAARVIVKIAALADTIGWDVAIPHIDSDDPLDHIFLGSAAALREIDPGEEIYTIMVRTEGGSN